MKDNIINFLKNPKVQLALFTLLSVIMAIGFFGDPNIPGVETAASTSATPAAATGAGAAGTAVTTAPAAATGADAAGTAGAAATTSTAGTAAAPAASVAATQVATASSKYLIATLSPMTAGFALLPFIISILGIGFSLMGIYKERTEHKRGKAAKRIEFIDNEKTVLNTKFDKLFAEKIDKAKGQDGNVITSEVIQEIKRYVNDISILDHADSKIDKIPAAGGAALAAGKLKFSELFENYSIKNEVDELRKIRKEIKVYEVIQQKDLKKTISEIDSEVNADTSINVPQGIRTIAVTKLAAAKKQTTKIPSRD
jgi:hypothetical protein